jgi:hypothetical protein
VVVVVVVLGDDIQLYFTPNCDQTWVVLVTTIETIPSN